MALLIALTAQEEELQAAKQKLQITK